MCIFAGAWMVFAPHPWALWSILGSALILFTSYFQVQVSVAINSWINGVADENVSSQKAAKAVSVQT
jgi:peptide/bleomycin uptake transporter